VLRDGSGDRRWEGPYRRETAKVLDWKQALGTGEKAGTRETVANRQRNVNPTTDDQGAIRAKKRNNLKPQDQDGGQGLKGRFQFPMKTGWD